MSKLVLKDIKKLLTGFDKEDREFEGDYTNYYGSAKKRGTITSYMIAKYPEKLYSFFETLCSTLPDDVTLEELLFNIELLVNDLSKGKCGFFNSSDTKNRFNALKNEIEPFLELPFILSYMPRYIDDVADPEFSAEFSRIFGIKLLGAAEIKQSKKFCGYKEVAPDIVDISNKNKAEVLAALYNHSAPIGTGIIQFDSTPMTKEMAEKLLKTRTYFSWLRGRPIHVDLEGNIINVSLYNRDNGDKYAQRAIGTCRNIREEITEDLSEITESYEKLEKQITSSIQSAVTNEQQSQESTNSSNGLEYLRVPKSDLMPMRRLVVEEGDNISEETLEFVKQIEDVAYPEEMKIMQDVDDLGGLEFAYGYYREAITIARNNDWYIISGEDDDSIEILDIASSPDRDVESSRREMHDYLVHVINKRAKEEQKTVSLNAKEDTSYRMIQRMIRNGEYEIVSDELNEWEPGSSIRMHRLVLNPIYERTNDRDNN